MTATVSESAAIQEALSRFFYDIEGGATPSDDLTKKLEKCVEKLTPQFSTIKGSPGYWRQRSRDLLSTVCSPIMKRPTIFMTLSAADTFWVDFMASALPNMSDEDIATMTKSQRNDVLAENPDLAVSHFHYRWMALWEEILNGDSKPLGEIEDYFWRVEFQARGSPHVHMMLWIKDAPNFTSLRDGPVSEEKNQFVDSRVCTSLALAVRDLDISLLRHPCSVRTPVASSGDNYFDAHVQSLAKAAQTHEWTGYCSDKRLKTGCRFGFPRSLEEETSIATVF